MRFSDDQASSRIVLDSGEVLTKCDQCRQLYSERRDRGIPGDPPCEDCWVELLPANESAHRIFNVVRNQLIMSFGGPIALNHSAIHEAMRLYRIKNRRLCFEKVLILGQYSISKMNEKNEG